MTHLKKEKGSSPDRNEPGGFANGFIPGMVKDEVEVEEYWLCCAIPFY